jgi:hypothetical protein
VPNDTLHEVRAAAHEIAEAALLRNVARDEVEAQHLLAARDLLAEAEPNLTRPLRARARRLDWDIGRDVGAAALESPADRFDALGPVSVRPSVDRADLGLLAQRAQTLAHLMGSGLASCHARGKT